MQKNNHTDFILSPIASILEDAISASAGVGNGIETFPLCDYLMQSVFLRMTGFQEQKLKCICWELATRDYEYRYKRYTKKTIGECSLYEEKKTIYLDLIAQIKKSNVDFDVLKHIDKKEILKSTQTEIETLFLNSNFKTWAQNAFEDFTLNAKMLKQNDFARNNNLLDGFLRENYELLYKHRNRTAHNTQSYQQNLPTLKTLAADGYRYDNYLYRFFLLILIDNTFVALYRQYLMNLEMDI